MAKIRLSFFLLLSLVIFSSCGPEIIFEKKMNIAPSGWAYADTLQYEFNISDTSQLYNLFLQLEHTREFSNQNLYVKMYTGFPDGKRLSQTISVDMADKMGRWLGDCSGDKCNLDIPIQSKAFFNQIGIHTFTLEQFMRTDSLPALLSASFRVELVEEN